ncbi:uncharacterized protein [Arachis hypogaea]|uniref:uncharacterized protein n=1 Tax=Arachis hypogaea TaxID=3818 RepID=UPI000DEC7641|nr:uncharacterized protein LOC112803902 [Arachis hypogaea]
MRDFGLTRWHIVDPNGRAGGLILAWREGIDVDIMEAEEFYIAAKVKNNCLEDSWLFIGVHLSHNDQLRSVQYNTISTMIQQHCGRVVIAGDFNAITSPNKKEGGGEESPTSIANFNGFIGKNMLVDLGMVSRRNTWSNRRSGEELIQERLDSFLASKEWMQLYANPMVLRLSKMGSDHAPLLLDSHPQTERSKRRFKFQDWWCNLEEGGTELLELEQKLEEAVLNEERYWKEKSRIKWLKEGDRNTTFFHRKFRCRIRRNKIWRLIGPNGEAASTHQGIAAIAEEYFQEIFTSSNQADPEPYFEDFEPKFTALMNRRLQRPVSIEKVKRATFSVHFQSVSGDDAHECMHYLKTKRTGFESEMAIKLDMSKAYDRVEWRFLWFIMGKLGFDGTRWIDWIRELVSIVSYSIIVEGQPFGYFKQEREDNCDNILNLLNSYEGFSGQQINLDKSTKGDERCMAWISWNQMIWPKREGGLGFKDLRAQNLVLLGKQFWRITTKPQSILVQIYRGKYYRYGNSINAESGHSPS